MNDKLFLFYSIVVSLFSLICLILGIGAAPSSRVYPRDRKIRIPEERQKFFKRLGVKYTPSLIFSKPCEVLANLEKEDFYSYSLFKWYYDTLSRWYGSYIVVNYVAPIFIQWVSNQVGYGLFADHDIPKDSFIMEYAGEVVKNTDNTTWSWTYPAKDGFWDTKSSFAIDARHYGNEARFANHGEDPNVRTELVYHGKVWHVVYLAARDIKKGEALLIHYGSGYWKHRKKIPLQATASV